MLIPTRTKTTQRNCQPWPRLSSVALALTSALTLTACASSPVPVTPVWTLPDLPAHVRREASSRTTIPVKAVSGKEAAHLIAELKRSEGRKVRALRSAVGVYDAARGKLAKPKSK